MLCIMLCIYVIDSAATSPVNYIVHVSFITSMYIFDVSVIFDVLLMFTLTESSRHQTAYLLKLCLLHVDYIMYITT